MWPLATANGRHAACWRLSPEINNGLIIASSQLDSVTVGEPTALYERFRHLGVWSLAEINRAARDGVAQALRFSNTDLFARPVPLARLRQLSAQYQAPIIPQAPRRIPASLFAAIYREGHTS